MVYQPECSQFLILFTVDVIYAAPKKPYLAPVLPQSEILQML